MCRVAAIYRLLNTAVQGHKVHAGFCSRIVTSKSLQITEREEFGKGCHSEPLFYDSGFPAWRDINEYIIRMASVLLLLKNSTLMTKVHVH